MFDKQVSPIEYLISLALCYTNYTRKIYSLVYFGLHFCDLFVTYTCHQIPIWKYQRRLLNCCWKFSCTAIWQGVSILKFFLCSWPRPRVFGWAAEIKSFLFFYHHHSRSHSHKPNNPKYNSYVCIIIFTDPILKFIQITKFILMFILSAAAAVGVEDERRFNFRCAAIRPKFAWKRPQLRWKKSK